MSHPLTDLFQALTKVASRTPWHSEAQHAEVMDHLRAAEAAMAPDAEPVVPAASVVATAPPAVTPAGETLDYEKLAAAIVQAQQADAATAANPGWTPPTSASVGDTSHAAAEA